MNKKIVYILASLLTCLVIFLTVFMIFGIINNGFSFGNYDNIIKEKTYDLNNIEDINFELVSSDIKFFVSNNNELRVVQYGNKKSEKFEEINDKNSIEILDDKHFNFIFFNFNHGSRYEIYLPSSYLNNLGIRTVSGDIDLNDFDLNLKDLNIKSTSGEISLDSIIQGNDFEIKSVSGDLYTGELNGNEIIIETTSGDIKTNKTVAKEVTISSISGKLVLGHTTGIAIIKTTSGDINIDDLLILNDSEISTISGEIDIKMNKNNNCIIDTHSLSGDKDVSSKKYGESKYDLKIKTTSGDIRVD